MKDCDKAFRLIFGMMVFAYVAIGATAVSMVGLIGYGIYKLFTML